MLSPACVLVLLSCLCLHGRAEAAREDWRHVYDRRFSVELHRRPLSRRDAFDRGRWMEAERDRLLDRYADHGRAQRLGRALHGRQVVSPTFTGLPSSAIPQATAVSTARTATPTASANATATVLRGLPDGTGGVVGLQRTFNFQADLEYFAPIKIGTPPQSLNLILDTGSSDTWLASPNCTQSNGCPLGVSSFAPANSSTVRNLTTPFTIRYGAGSANGTMYSDNVTLAGYELPGQTFALVDTISSNLLSQNISGLLGLGFETLSTSGVTPLWQSLLSNSSYNFTFPGFTFALTRFINASAPTSEVEPGGLFTLGTLNASLFTGDINFVAVPENLESYWLVPMDAINVNGTAIDMSGEATSNVAIDTGTTLLGGPPTQVQALYAQIPGSAAISGSYQGYYTYPCNASVNIAMTFGGVSYAMSPQDFNLGPFGSTDSTCLGAIFELDLAGASRQLISWVIGDSFLKNVFTVFRYSPAAVGFARLSPLFNATGQATVQANGTLYNNATLNLTAEPTSTAAATTSSSSSFSASAADQTVAPSPQSTITPTSHAGSLRPGGLALLAFVVGACATWE